MSHKDDIIYSFEEHWPRCPNQDKTTPIAASEVKCYLIDRNTLSGTHLPDCTVEKENLIPGDVYGLEFKWSPPDGQNSQTEIIVVQVAKEKIYCNFEGGTLHLVDTTQAHTLAP